MKYILGVLMLGFAVQIFGQSATTRDTLRCPLKYPAKARKNNIQGVVEIKIKLDSVCNVTKHEIVKSIGFGCDEAALAILPCVGAKVKKENNSNYKSVPEKTFPVTFKLE